MCLPLQFAVLPHCPLTLALRVMQPGGVDVCARMLILCKQIKLKGVCHKLNWDTSSHEHLFLRRGTVGLCQAWQDVPLLLLLLTLNTWFS